MCGTQILENTALRKLATTRSSAISLIEHRRAHNICIELSGIRMPFADIKVLHCPTLTLHTRPVCSSCLTSTLELSASTK